MELAADQLDPQDEALDEGGLVGDRHGLGHQGQALLQEFGAAGAVEIIELLEGGGLGLLDGLQAGPLEQEAGGQRAPEVLAAQLQGLRKILL